MMQRYLLTSVMIAVGFALAIFLAGFFGDRPFGWNIAASLFMGCVVGVLRHVAPQGRLWSLFSRIVGFSIGFFAVWWYLGHLSWVFVTVFMLVTVVGWFAREKQ